MHKISAEVHLEILYARLTVGTLLQVIKIHSNCIKRGQKIKMIKRKGEIFRRPFQINLWQQMRLSLFHAWCLVEGREKIEKKLYLSYKSRTI